MAGVAALPASADGAGAVWAGAPGTAPGMAASAVVPALTPRSCVGRADFAGRADAPVVPDCALPDCALPDCAPPDCAPPDCAPPDCAPPDCAPPDCAPPDCAVPDCAAPDSPP